MNKKLTLLLIGALLVVGVGVFIATDGFSNITGGGPNNELRSYRSGSAGIGFDYPAGYRLEERSERFEGAPLLVVTLIDEDAEVPDMSEGPTSISMINTNLPDGMTLEDWVRTKSISNFGLSQDGVLSPTTLAGLPALAYRHSGLYESDAVAVEYRGEVYVFSVGWLTEEDSIRHDFEHVLASVYFL